MYNAIWAVAIMAYCVIQRDSSLMWYAFGIYTVINCVEEFLYRSGKFARFAIFCIDNRAFVRSTGRMTARGCLLYYILRYDKDSVDAALKIKEFSKSEN